MSEQVLVLGAGGRLGVCVAQAFANQGWRVRAQTRRTLPKALQDHAEPAQFDATDANALAHAARGCQVVVNALNPIYTRWTREALPLAEAGIAAALGAQALLLYPGNVYNYGATMPERLDESVPMAATTRKGRIRVEIEQRIRAATTTQELRAAVIRAGDFYGGPGRGSWFDLVIAKSLRRGIVTYPGPLDVVHAWAYLPDLARWFVRAAERRATFATGFETLHFPGHACSGCELVAALERVTGRPLRVRRLPWGAIRLLSPLVPMWRELAEMRYLWDVPHRLDGGKGERLLSPLSATSLEDALRAALAELGLHP